ncbi:hypothetical protein [Glutamicibacter arilaitensis]|uniref:hypothetical protein n=1 Tax=Glutamicibacter arilaitensis TaxID=256701 RepID=UPI0011AF8845|nr:hypothetical protein [Glutamicibacter arilaitensis]
MARSASGASVQIGARDAEGGALQQRQRGSVSCRRREESEEADAARDLEVFDDGPGLADSDSVVEQKFGEALEQA